MGHACIVGDVETLSHLAARIRAAAHTSLVQTAGHFGITRLGRRVPIEICRRFSAWLTVNGSTAECLSRSIGLCFDYSPSWEYGFGPAGTVVGDLHHGNPRVWPCVAAVEALLPFQVRAQGRYALGNLPKASEKGRPGHGGRIDCPGDLVVASLAASLGATMTVQTFTNVGNRHDLLSIVQLDADVGSAVLGSNYLGSAMPHHIRNLSFKRRALVNVKDVRAQDTLK